MKCGTAENGCNSNRKRSPKSIGGPVVKSRAGKREKGKQNVCKLCCIIK